MAQGSAVRRRCPVAEHAHAGIADETAHCKGSDDEEQQNQQAMAETLGESRSSGGLRKLARALLPGVAAGSFEFRPSPKCPSLRLTAGRPHALCSGHPP